jgi:methylglutaconyl-CoA hydratase
MVKTVQVRVDGPRADVTLDRPDVRNAFNPEMIAELTDTFTEFREREDVQVVVLRGNGRSFCAGADVQWMQSSLVLSREENEADALRMSDMFAAIDGAPQVVIAGIHGAALGGGMGIAAVCDIVIAGEKTQFGFTEAKLGIIPAIISRFVLHRIGASWARALYLSAERFGADTARQIGLVHWVVPEDDLEGAIEEKVREVLTSGPNATREAKRLIAQAMQLPRSELRGFTADAIARLRTSEEGQEGLHAFLEKRTPAWRTEDGS